MADDADIFDNLLEDNPTLGGLIPKKSGTDSTALGKAIIRGATRLGVSPVDLATAMSYETKGTFNPDLWSDKPDKNGKNHFGLIQFGPDEMKKYGVKPGMDVGDQVDAAVDYLADRGVKPGMGLMDIYSTINAGAPGQYSASDRPGMTVYDHVANMDQHVGNAKALLSGLIDKPEDTPQDFNFDIDTKALESKQETSPVGGKGFSPVAPWGEGRDLINKILLGTGSNFLLPAGQAGKALVQTGDLGQAVDTFKQSKEAYQQAAEQWQQENPGKDIGNFLLGAVPATVALTAATRGKAGPLMEQGLAAASPRLAPQIMRFLGGGAGEGSTGLGGLATRALSRTAEGVLEGGFAGGLQSGLTKNDFGTDIALNAGMGGVFNALLGPLAPTMRKYFQGDVSPEIEKVFAKAKNLGIDLKGGQISRNPLIRETAQKAGAMGDEAQLAQYTKAINKEFGETGDTISQDVIEKGYKRIGDGMGKVAKGVGNLGDNTLDQTLARLDKEALADFGGEANNASYQSIKSWLGQIGRMSLNGQLDGPAYQTLRRSTSGFMRNLVRSPDANLQHFGGKIVEALDDALGRADPVAFARMKNLRQQWAALRQVEPIVDKSGPGGYIDPQKMSKLVGSKTGNLSDLADIGQLLPKTTPQGAVKESANIGEGLKHLLGKIGLATGVGAGAGAAGFAGIERAPEILNMLGQSTGGLLGAAALGTSGLAKYGVNKYIQSLMHDPAYAEALFMQGMPLGANMIEAAGSVPVLATSAHNLNNLGQ